MAAKAASIAVAEVRGTAISTKVPSNGRHRRTVDSAVGEDDCISGEQTPNPIGDVFRREGCARNIPNVVAEFQRSTMVFASELRPPGRLPDFTAVGLAIIKNLDILHAAGGVKRHGASDEFVFAHDLIHDKPAAAL